MIEFLYFTQCIFKYPVKYIYDDLNYSTNFVHATMHLKFKLFSGWVILLSARRSKIVFFCISTVFFIFLYINLWMKCAQKRYKDDWWDPMILRFGTHKNDWCANLSTKSKILAFMKKNCSSLDALTYFFIKKKNWWIFDE